MKETKKIYVFGNPYLENDNFAHKVAGKLKNIQVVPCRGPEELIGEKEELLIIDVVNGINKPLVIKSIEQLKARKLTSLHDFDVGFFLHLLNKVGAVKRIKIIGVPEKGDSKKIAKKVEEWI